MDKSVTGVVTQVGDERFELADDADRRHVFMLALDASVEGGQLRDLQRERTRVIVDYDEDTPGDVVRVAHRVCPLVPPA